MKVDVRFSPKSEVQGAIARRIVELHGGRLSLSSRIEEGTTVLVEIPAMPPGWAARGPSGLDRMGMTDMTWRYEAAMVPAAPAAGRSRSPRPRCVCSTRWFLSRGSRSRKARC